MDHEASISHVDVLQKLLLDDNAEPMDLPLSLLQNITNNFSFDYQIGSGGFAVVYKGVVEKGMVAVKKLTKTNALPENKFHQEVKCLIKAKHKNIVRFLGYCAETQGKMEKYEGEHVMADQRNWLLCFEYACNGSLDKHITDATCGLNWMQRYQIIRGISEGLLFLHDKKILHLDLKPANILLDGHMVPKLADFGLSRCLGELQTRAITQNICGTPGYMDPEYIRSGQITFASDIYSLGIVIIEILTGVRQYLEDEHAVESWMSRLEASEGDMQLEQFRVCYKIAIECVDLDPKKRPVARNIVDRLDKMRSVDHSDETSLGSSLFELQVSLPREQSGERIGKLAAESLYTGFYELSILDIYSRTAHMIFDTNNRHTSELSHFVNIFKTEDLRPIIRSSNLIREVNSTKVYKGVVDNALVAVKQTFNVDEKQLENEVIIQSQVIHKNIACLIGCCLEMDTPILVYEFLPRGSLHDILHSSSKVPLNLDVRLNIVAESAQGLVYLHSQARTKILHGDVKPANILLDDNFMPKITVFGLSRLTARDNEHTFIAISDMTYIDPVYMQTGILTEKSDVYSFGVVILELISRKPTYIDGVWLVQSFIEFHREGKKATELFDKEIAVTTRDLEILDCLAKIAVDCVNLDVDHRPMTTEVAERLLILNRSRRLHARHINADYSEELQGVQDMNHHGGGNSSSVSTGFSKLNNLDIFNWKGRRKFNRDNMHKLEKSHFIKFFRKEELMPMLSSLIGKGYLGVVHKVIVDNALVTVKKLNYGSEIDNRQFENEVLIQSQVVHRNIIRLIGCCIERKNNMLVYEFFQRGSLDEILHGGSRVPLNLDVRLNIVGESAQGLAYLHSQARIKILHSNVKPSNILLDEDFIPKISDFGQLRLIVSDGKHTGWVIGDASYMDPVYMQTGLPTLKSDVYSFGIVILELISRKKATHSDNNNLVRSFLEAHKEGKKATELFDKEIAVTGGDLELLDCLTEIAMECIDLDVYRRPTMTDVAARLLILNRSRSSKVICQ